MSGSRQAQIDREEQIMIQEAIQLSLALEESRKQYNIDFAANTPASVKVRNWCLG